MPGSESQDHLVRPYNLSQIVQLHKCHIVTKINSSSGCRSPNLTQCALSGLGLFAEGIVIRLGTLWAGVMGTVPRCTYWTLLTSFAH